MGRVPATALVLCLLAAASCATGPAKAPPENAALNVFPGPPPPPPYEPVPADTPIERSAIPAEQGAVTTTLTQSPSVSDAPQVAVTPPQDGIQPSTQTQAETYQPGTYQPSPTYQPTYQPSTPAVGPCAENGSCYGDISNLTGRPKTVAVRGYYRRDGTYVRGHYRSH